MLSHMAFLMVTGELLAVVFSKKVARSIVRQLMSIRLCHVLLARIVS